MGAWTPQVFLDPQSQEPVYLQIAQAIMADIHRGRLRPGDPLPGYQALVEQLMVSRNTVIAAYNELRSEGWVVSKAGEGSVVAPEPPALLPSRLEARPVGFDLAQGAAEAEVAASANLLKVVSGLPDPRLLPGSELARAYRRALTLNRQQNLELEDPQGHPRLRESLARMLTDTRGIVAEPGQILVTRGSQMALFLAGQALLAPGDAVAVEALGLRDAWEAFARAGGRCLPIPVDEEGIRVEALAELLQSARIKVALVTPRRQYPTLAPLSPSRRQRLLALAREHRFAVLEVDQDSEFQFEGRPQAPLAAEDRAGVVVHVGTLSKIFSPNLRLGFVHGPEHLITRMRALRQALDRQGDMVLERAFAELLDDGEISRHLNRMQKAYRKRRDALCEALHRELGAAVAFDPPGGGLALWVKVAEGIDVDRWAAQALQRGVAFQPGRQFAFDLGTVPAFRIGFSNYPEPELEEVARRLAQALTECR